MINNTLPGAFALQMHFISNLAIEFTSWTSNWFWISKSLFYPFEGGGGGFMVMVFNVTFNNCSVIS